MAYNNSMHDKSIINLDKLRDDYDFSKLGKAVRGKYAKRVKAASNVILLDEDVAKVFPNERSVNEALRLLISLANGQVSQSENKSLEQ